MNTSEENNQITPIGDLAKNLGVTTRTLRYWEEVGIIESAERTDGANRGYSPYYVRRIKFILKLKDMGLTIKEMQDLYAAYGEAKETHQMIPKLVDILDKHTQQVDEKVAKLQLLRKEIVDYRQKMAARHASLTGQSAH
jgi:DNA-binding transcriptional MerR regulator